eukprot:4425439-Alexandrium_andersonii.AAC.1
MPYLAFGRPPVNTNHALRPESRWRGGWCSRGRWCRGNRWRAYRGRSACGAASLHAWTAAI